MINLGRRLIAVFATAIFALLLSFAVPSQAAHTGIVEGKPDKLALLKLLRQGDLEALDDRLLALQQSHEAQDVTNWYVDQTFRAFASTDPAIENQADAWKKARPDSFAPYLALAMHYGYLAYKYRGEAYINQTPTPRLEAMVEFGRAAIHEYMGAIERNPKVLSAHLGLIDLLNTLGNRQESLARLIFAKQTLDDPSGLEYLEKKLNSERWGGGASISRWIDIVSDLVFSVFADAHAKEQRAAAQRFEEAFVLMDRGLFDEALNILNEIAHLSFDYARQQAWVLERDRRYGDALLVHARMLEQNPHDLLRLQELVELLDKSSDDEAKMRYIATILQLSPLDPQALRIRAGRHLAHGATDRALEDYDAALIHGLFDGNILIEAARVMVGDDTMRERGADVLEHMMELYPDSPHQLLWVADTWFYSHRCEDLDRVDAIYRQVKEICRSVGGNCDPSTQRRISGGENVVETRRQACPAQP